MSQGSLLARGVNAYKHSVIILVFSCEVEGVFAQIPFYLIRRIFHHFCVKFIF